MALIKTNTAGLVGWWPFDNASVNDASNHPTVNGSLNGTPFPSQGIARPVNGPKRGGFQFSVSGQYINLTNDTSLISPECSYIAWVYVTALTAAYGSVIGRMQDGNNFFVLYVKSNGKLACFECGFNAGGQTAYDGTGIATLATNTWYHLGMVFNTAATADYLSKTITGYVNGVFDGSSRNTGGTGINWTGGTTTLGYDILFASRNFLGIVDDVRVYNRALSPGEVFAIAQEPFRPPGYIDLVNVPPLNLTPTLVQKHFRFRTDTGAADATPTWGALEDTN
jgi:hypothetical protein